MSRSTYPRLFAATALLVLAVSLRAQVVTYTWTGRADGMNFTSPGNWLGGVVPAEDLVNTRIVFANARPMHVDYNEIWANQLRFEGRFDIDLHGGWDTTHLGAGGIFYNPNAPVKSYLIDAVQLHASQTWNIATGTLAVDGPISDFDGMGYGGFGITKSGLGTLEINYDGNSSWSGGLTLSQGRVAVRPYGDYYSAYYTSALGFGTLTFNGGTLVAKDEGYDEGMPVMIPNHIVSNGLISTENHAALVLGYDQEGYSNILLTADTTVRSKGKPLFLRGFLHDNESGRKLTIDSEGAVIIDGPASYYGGTAVTKGVLIFGTSSSIPSSGQITVASLGYAGLGTTAVTPSAFLAKFNPAQTLGTIGFDSDPESSMNEFSGTIDLTGFNAGARLGSATSARLGFGSSIVPQGNDFRFGGGGGYLYVDAYLNGANNVIGDSPAELPLTVRFGNNDNGFTGAVSATHTALIFSDTALPASNPLFLGPGGYIGREDIIQGAGNTQAFINRFVSSTDRGMIGFDAASEHVTITDSINLGAFSDADPGIYLGTASRAHLNGVITPQGNTFRFGAYKGGELTVNSQLTGAGNAVHIGDPQSLGTMGDFNAEEYSTVYLRGDNSYGGNTLLYAGRLRVGQTNGATGEVPTTALGTGTLVVQPYAFTVPGMEPDVAPSLEPDYNVILPNAIQLNSDLAIDAYESDFTLAGSISGAGALRLEGEYSTITLSGNNTFTGGIYLSGGSMDLVLGSNTAAGAGPMGFGGGGGATIFFDTAAPVIGGLYRNDGDDYAYFYANVDNTTLTINQATDGAFAGDFRSDLSRGALRVVKAGAGALHLDSGGLYVYDGVAEPALANAEVTLQVNAGTLILGSGFYIGETNTTNPGAVPPIEPTTVWVNGGTLALDAGAHVNNPVVVTSGALAGLGYFSAATIGANARITPGFALQLGDPVGMLNFGDLTLAGGGLLEWNLRTPDPLAADYDRVNVAEIETLHVTATVDNPETAEDERFTLKLISLAANGTPGVATGFSGDRTYTYTIFDATFSSIDGFDPSKFAIDASQFLTDLPIASLTLSQNGNLIQLTFQPVPEPSTYMLLGLGLSFVGLAARRRFSARRRS